MTYTVRVMPRAARYLAVAVRWWRQHRPEAPSLLEDEFEALLVGLTSFPERGVAIDEKATRRRLHTRTSKLLVIYRVRPSLMRVEVVELRGP